VKTELVPLNSLLKNEEVGAVPGFPALIGDRQVTVTAVLERTVVFEPAAGEPRQLARIGERSAHTWFVLKELLGYPEVRNYDGSWTEWGSAIRVPIEK